jgi:8-oxo-dGTP pyrophosphatase MutT (NUDIX family)
MGFSGGFPKKIKPPLRLIHRLGHNGAKNTAADDYLAPPSRKKYMTHPLVKYVDRINAVDWDNFPVIDLGGSRGYPHRDTVEAMEKWGLASKASGTNGHDSVYILHHDFTQGDFNYACNKVRRVIHTNPNDSDALRKITVAASDESFPIAGNGHGPLEMPRYLAYALGAPSRSVGGVVNVKDADGKVLYIWEAVRGGHEQARSYGMIDVVNGAFRKGETPKQAVLRETDEEFGATEADIRSLQSMGTQHVTLPFYTGSAVKCEQIETFDVEVGANFKPQSKDGKVQSFRKTAPVEFLANIEHGERYKSPADLEIIHFLMVHGIIRQRQPGEPKPDHGDAFKHMTILEPVDYRALVNSMQKFPPGTDEAARHSPPILQRHAPPGQGLRVRDFRR